MDDLFRPRYRVLSGAEKALYGELRARYGQLEEMILGLPTGRYRALALTALKESRGWAMKHLTDNG